MQRVFLKNSSVQRTSSDAPLGVFLAAKVARQEMEQNWDSVSEVRDLEIREGLIIDFADDTN